MKRQLNWLGLVLCSLVIPGLCHAQDSTLAPAIRTRPAEPGVGGPVLGGVVFLVGGGAAGALIANAGSHDCAGEDGCLDRDLTGFTIGAVVGLGLGVHLGNRGRGNVWLDIATAGGIGLVGGAIVNAADTDGVGAFAWFVPIGMLIGTVEVERRVGRARDRRTLQAISLMPAPHGATLAVRLTLPHFR